MKMVSMAIRIGIRGLCIIMCSNRDRKGKRKKLDKREVGGAAVVVANR